jgi:hypothetical protein
LVIAVVILLRRLRSSRVHDPSSLYCIPSIVLLLDFVLRFVSCIVRLQEDLKMGTWEKLEIEEVVPLSGAKADNSSPGGSRFRLLQRFVGIVTIVAIIGLFFVLGENSEEESAAPSELEGHTRAKIPKKQCPKFCEARLVQRIAHQGGDLLQNPYLLTAATNAREKMVEQLKVNYGEDVYKKMFEEPDGTSRGSTAFWGATDSGDNGKEQGPSKARFRRKLKIKLLEVQRAILEQEANVSGCDCTAKKEGRRRLQEPSTTTTEVGVPELPSSYSTFVWSTGGHSAAAGHGNLYNESYTAYMEGAVKDVFAAVGVDFQGRNYAMGGMSSGPELGMCQEAVYGIDADVISWDFGMTDGNEYWKTLLYASRVGMHRNKPAVIEVNAFGDSDTGGLTQLKTVEKEGLTALYLNIKKWENMVEAIPDMFGMSSEDMAKVAPFARDFKCKEVLEKGEPTCEANKYNDAICKDRQHKAGWHPGWRVQSAHGFIMALFMSDMLLDAIKELGNEPYDPSELFSKLREEEAAEYATFYASTPEITEGLVSGRLDFADKPLMEVFAKMFRKDNIICHTALLPAQTRYLGILMETDKVGTKDFEKGISEQQAIQEKASDDEKDKRQMRLAFETGVRQPDCPVDLKWDYKDFFYTSQDDGWTSMTVPNKSELDYYNKAGKFKPEGIVLLCFMKCDWGKCPNGDMQFDQVLEGKLKLTVNGVAVTKFNKVSECALLQHGQGDYYFKPNDEGQFEFRALVEKAEEGKVGNYARITSIVVM